jgi:hypothetical protein
MKRHGLVVALLLLACGAGLASSDRNSAEDQRVEYEVGPNPQLARPLRHDPTPEDWARLHSVVGQPPREVIRRLGHPSHIPGQDGKEWHYYWGREKVWVIFHEGRAVKVDSTCERSTGWVEPTAGGL